MRAEKDKIYKTAIYIRLSKEDGDKIESNSVTNQRELIMNFVANKKDLDVVYEKIDDGYSGVSFDRPAFNELLADIKAGEINCIICKDLSRFGRNYVEAGRFIEQIFPFLGVRFIAINDDFDTGNEQSQSDKIILPFKNLMNDAYSLDISTKTRSQIAIRQAKGEFIGAAPVFGYKKSTTHKNKLVIDEIASKTVKEIFSMRLDGYNNGYIAKHLNDLGVPSPLLHKEVTDSNFKTSFKVFNNLKWSDVAISRILKNEVYTGVMVNGKETTQSYKVKKRIKQSSENLIRVENSHEAIISKEVFKVIQKLMLNDTRTSPYNQKLYLLSGMLKCGTCGSNMVRKNVKVKNNTYATYICTKYKESKDNCTSHSIRESYVEEILLTIINRHIETICLFEELLDNLDSISFQNINIKNRTEQLSVCKNELTRYNNLKISIYEDSKNGLLTENEFLEMKNSYNKKCNEISENVKLLEQEIENINANNNCDWLAEFKNMKNLKELTRSSLVLLIDKIVVIDATNIKVHFNYQDEFNYMYNFLKETLKNEKNTKISIDNLEEVF